MDILVQFLLVGVIFFSTCYFSWYITEKKRCIPEFLEYKPFQCRLCLTFWLLVAIYLIIGISFEMWVVIIAGIILAILNAIAMKVNQNNKTIYIE